MIKRPKSEEAKRERAIQIGEQILDLRMGLGLTQTEFAEKVDVTKDAVSKWERGIREPSENAITRICIAIGCKYHQDFGFSYVNTPCKVTDEMVGRELPDYSKRVEYAVEINKIIYNLPEEQMKIIYHLAYQLNEMNEEHKKLEDKLYKIEHPDEVEEELY